MNPDYDYRLTGLSYGGYPLNMQEKYKILYNVRYLDGYTFEVLDTYLELGMKKLFENGKLPLSSNLGVWIKIQDNSIGGRVAEFLLMNNCTTFDLMEIDSDDLIGDARCYLDIDVSNPPNYIQALLRPEQLISCQVVSDDNVDMFYKSEVIELIERSGLTYIEVLNKIAIEGNYGVYYSVTQHPIASYRFMTDDPTYPFEQDLYNLTRSDIT